MSESMATPTAAQAENGKQTTSMTSGTRTNDRLIPKILAHIQTEGNKD